LHLTKASVVIPLDAKSARFSVLSYDRDSIGHKCAESCVFVCNVF
jgi:hypothetical protein